MDKDRVTLDAEERVGLERGGEKGQEPSVTLKRAKYRFPTPVSGLPFVSVLFSPENRTEAFFLALAQTKSWQVIPPYKSNNSKYDYNKDEINTLIDIFPGKAENAISIIL